MAELVVGPLLRYVDGSSATVWAETDRPCTVRVRCGGGIQAAEPTWCVAGHHFALVVVDGLAPGSVSTYNVELDGDVVWPVPDVTHPPSTIRTLPAPAPGGPGAAGTPAVRVAFGSCRWASPPSVVDGRLEPDALDTLAATLPELPRQEWPDALLLLGDQVYADEVSALTRAWLAERRDLNQPPWDQVADFEEYTRLYHESWQDPEIRWLLSTVPSAMVCDDHDVIDDWNTSASWRDDMRATDWWEERILSGLASYWVYQHLGNLSPAELAADEVYAAVRRAGGGPRGDAAAVLREHARRADAETDGRRAVRWSYRRDLGRVRVLMVDSRAGRVLQEDRRAMISDDELDWLAAQAAEPGYDHLLLGTSLPWLLPHAVHDLEGWNEALASGARGRRAVRWSERLRRAGDLEHWAAFRRSFHALSALLLDIATPAPAPADAPRDAAPVPVPGRTPAPGRAEPPPATICVLSGDVHHAYLAEAHPSAPGTTPGPGSGTVARPSSRLVQLTCSPVHNAVPAVIRLGFRIGWGRAARRFGRALARHARLPASPVTWEKTAGPYFGNQLMTLTLSGRNATVLLQRAVTGPDGKALLRTVVSAPLTGPTATPAPAPPTPRAPGDPLPS
ncbi:alkaline phosphatase D family protein [Allostreptomyces psammosilenae]|uniref:PhoD-like phosphatase metallophosphatase domain-containing protein n=1 Tax=Allostreptomyces psammosilenae TaxID=1892865 RepID=A0A852ZQB9_9ACTN|nr:alkaline phosphatase D family protein [Allostreptomyces psammosilenae]NYI03687.1 hypothetical protein [Allostreptomyces psammosilenae]